jgi:hypothetical protein
MNNKNTEEIIQNIDALEKMKSALTEGYTSKITIINKELQTLYDILNKDAPPDIIYP